MTHLLCRLARLGGKQTARAMLRAEAVRRHAQGDQPSRHTPAVPTSSVDAVTEQHQCEQMLNEQRGYHTTRRRARHGS